MSDVSAARERTGSTDAADRIDLLDADRVKGGGFRPRTRD